MTYDNFDDEFLDEDEQAEYNKKYLAELQRSAAGLKDNEDEIAEEFNLRHNFKRSDDPASDARRNFLEAKNSIENRNKSMDSGTKSYLDYVDKRDGKGSGAKLLKRSQANQDDSFFDPETNPNIRGLK